MPDVPGGGLVMAVGIVELVGMASGGLGVVGGPDSGVSGEGGLVAGPVLQGADACFAAASAGERAPARTSGNPSRGGPF